MIKVEVVDNLTKENFFDSLQQRYPNAMKHFCEWIDGYKAANNWKGLFNQGWEMQGGYTKAPKFYELPLAMQMGIMFQYAAEMSKKDFSRHIVTTDFSKMMEALEKMVTTNILQ